MEDDKHKDCNCCYCKEKSIKIRRLLKSNKRVLKHGDRVYKKRDYELYKSDKNYDIETYIIDNTYKSSNDENEYYTIRSSKGQTTGNYSELILLPKAKFVLGTIVKLKINNYKWRVSYIINEYNLDLYMKYTLAFVEDETLKITVNEYDIEEIKETEEITEKTKLNKNDIEKKESILQKIFKILD